MESKCLKKRWQYKYMPKTETPKVDHLPSVADILPVFDNILDDIESHVAKKKPLSQYILLQLQMVRDLIENTIQ